MGFRLKTNNGPRLCCTLNKEIICDFCKEEMCLTCGRAWASLAHFVLDQCRKRFSSSELAEAAKCYKDRLQTDGKVKGLGKCKICVERNSLRRNDRCFLAEEDTSGWPFQDVDLDLDDDWNDMS